MTSQGIGEYLSPSVVSNPIERTFQNSGVKENHPARMIGELPGYHLAVDQNTSTAVVLDEFNRNHQLPGALVFNGQSYLGMVSRQKCFEMLGRPFGVEIFTKRNIGLLIEDSPVTLPPLPASTSIEAAVRLALNRAADMRYEPLVVSYNTADYGLVDFQAVLLAQSQLVAHANRAIQQQLEIGSALSSTLDTHKILDLILDHLAELVPFDQAAILIEDRHLLQLVASRGFPADFDPKKVKRLLRDSDTYQQIFLMKTPILISDAAIHSQLNIIDRFPSTHAWMGVPLVYINKVIGILSLGRKDKRDFTSEECETVQSLAGQATVALNNAFSYDQIKQFSQNLETIVRKRTIDLQGAYDKLEVIDRTKTDFINIASQELNKPLQRIIHSAQMLAEKHQIDEDNGVVELKNNLIRLNEVIGEMTDVARLESNQYLVRLAPCNLEKTLDGICQSVTPFLKEREVSLFYVRKQVLPPILCDEGELKKVFTTLILNAIKFTPPGRSVQVKKFYHPQELSPLGVDSVEIMIDDQGIGIAPEHLEIMFTKYFKLLRKSENNDSPSGPYDETSLGLTLVRGIVEAHAGKVWAISPGMDETACPGASFHVVLPLRPPAGEK
jgi:signal transduction histidine kinase